MGIAYQLALNFVLTSRLKWYIGWMELIAFFSQHHATSCCPIISEDCPLC